MKKLNIIKTLSNLIQGSVKAKIATGIIGVVLVGGGVGGTFYYLNNKNNPPEYKIAGTEKEPNSKEVERTEEEKERDEKQVKLISLKKELKELDPNFKEEDNNELDLSNKELDELIGKYEASKKDLIDKKEEGSKKEEDSSTTSIASTGSTGNSSTSTGGGSSNTTQGGNSNTSTSGGNNTSSTEGGSEIPQQPEEAPDTTTPPATTPSIPSGWKDDVAQYALSKMTTSITNVPSGPRTQAQLDTMNSQVNSWFNGNGVTISSINQVMKDNYLKDTDFPLQLHTLTVFTIKGLDKSIISDSCFQNRTSHGQQGYVFIKVYYDGSTDTSTVYLAAGR